MKKLVLLLALFLAFSLAVFAGGEKEGAGAPQMEGKTFTLGVLGPFSGPSARTGEEFKGSVNMAFDAVNWKIGDYAIKVVWIDSQSDPAKATFIA